MTTLPEIRRKIVLALWADDMECTRTDTDEIRVTTDDGSEFGIIVSQVIE